MSGRRLALWGILIVILVFVATDAATANSVMDGLISTATRLIHDIYTTFNPKAG